MRRYIMAMIVMLVLSFPLFSDTVLLHMQYPEAGTELNLGMVMAYLENGIVDALFDSGMIIFGESGAVVEGNREWDRWELQEMRASSGADWLMAVQIRPSEGELFVVYYVLSGGAGLSARAGNFPLNPSGAPLDTWCYLRGQEMVEEMIDYSRGGE